MLSIEWFPFDFNKLSAPCRYSDTKEQVVFRIVKPFLTRTQPWVVIKSEEKKAGKLVFISPIIDVFRENITEYWLTYEYEQKSE